MQSREEKKRTRNVHSSSGMCIVPLSTQLPWAGCVPRNSHIEALTPNVPIIRNRAFSVVIKVK